MAVPGSTIGRRIKQAMLDFSFQLDTAVTQADFGRAIAKQEGRKTAYTGAAVSDWINGKSEPSLAAIAAISALSMRPKEWLGWGTGPEWILPAAGEALPVYPPIFAPAQTDKRRSSTKLKVAEPSPRKRKRG